MLSLHLGSSFLFCSASGSQGVAPDPVAWASLGGQLGMQILSPAPIRQAQWDLAMSLCLNKPPGAWHPEAGGPCVPPLHGALAGHCSCGDTTPFARGPLHTVQSLPFSDPCFHGRSGCLVAVASDTPRAAVMLAAQAPWLRVPAFSHPLVSGHD